MYSNSYIITVTNYDKVSHWISNFAKYFPSKYVYKQNFKKVKILHKFKIAIICKNKKLYLEKNRTVWENLISTPSYINMCYRVPVVSSTLTNYFTKSKKKSPYISR